MIIIAKSKGMLSPYEIYNYYVIIYINKKGFEKPFEVYIDLEDLDKVKKYSWNIQYNKNNNEFYASTNIYYKTEDGKLKSYPLWMSRYILDITERSRSIQADHVGHDTLDNRKNNLRISKSGENSANRKGANKNNKTTGVRNITYIERDNVYWVQFMKAGERFRWIFPLSQFEEAYEFAKKKRQELFGEFAGKE